MHGLVGIKVQTTASNSASSVFLLVNDKIECGSIASARVIGMYVTYQRISMLIVLGIVFAFTTRLVSAAEKYSVLSFTVGGASCVTCIIEIERSLRRTTGVKAVSINQAKQPLMVFVIFDRARTSPAAIAKVLQDRKYQVSDQKILPYDKNSAGKFLRSTPGGISPKGDQTKLISP